MSFVRIAGYPMDLSLSEGHSFPGESTQYPVESGADISDHIRDLPEEITLECIVSDTPIGDIASDPTRAQVETPNGLIDPNAPLPSADALAKLRELKALRRTVTIETSIGVFESMAFIDLDVPVDKDKNNALFFTAKFKKLRLVTNTRSKVRVRTDMANGGKGKNKAGVPMKIDNTILWQHGVPPGQPWRQIDPQEFVFVTYSKSGGLSHDESVAFGQVAPDSSFITYKDEKGVVITGARYVALVTDLRRDRNFKQKVGLLASKRTPIAAGGGENSLPRGVDLSRIKRDAPPPFSLQNFSGPLGGK